MRTREARGTDGQTDTRDRRRHMTMDGDVRKADRHDGDDDRHTDTR